MNNIYRLYYKESILCVSHTRDDIEWFLNRSMFNNIDDESFDKYIHIKKIKYISDIDLDYVLILPYDGILMTTKEYTLLSILYDNIDSIHNECTRYQFMYSHPIFIIDNIDRYIRYREELDKLCELDIDYRQFIERTLI